MASTGFAFALSPTANVLVTASGDDNSQSRGRDTWATFSELYPSGCSYQPPTRVDPEAATVGSVTSPLPITFWTTWDLAASSRGESYFSVTYSQGNDLRAVAPDPVNPQAGTIAPFVGTVCECKVFVWRSHAGLEETWAGAKHRAWGISGSGNLL